MRLLYRPADDALRLETLRSYELLDTPPEAALDDLTALAAQICNAPIALISLIDDRRQWIKAKVGTNAEELPREASFCAHTILQSDVFVVPDALKDERFAGNPLASGDPQIRFYAGAPLVTATGHAIGTLCVAAPEPRELTEAQKTALHALARQVMAQFELRRKSRTLAESDAKFSAAFHSSSVVFAIVALNGELVEVNPAFCELIGFSREEALGKSFVDLGLLSAPERNKMAQALAAAGNSVRDVEIAFRDRHGRTRHVLYSMEPISINGLTHRLASGVEITARKESDEQIAQAALLIEQERLRAEAARKVTEERLRLAVRAAQVGLWDWNVEANEVTYSSEWKSQLGYAEHEIGNTYGEWAHRLHPDDLPAAQAYINRYVAYPKGTYEIDYRMRHKDGSWRHFHARGEGYCDANGQLVRLLGCQSDITGRKETEESLRENQEKLRKVIDGLGPNIFLGLMTPDGRLIEANRAGLIASGLQPEHVLGKPFDQIVWWSYSAPVRHRLQAAIRRAAEGEASRYDEQICVNGGTLMWIDFSLQPVRDAHGRVIYLVPSASVIDERVRAQAAQQESLERFQAVARATNDAVWDWDLAAGTLWWNENFCSLFGYTPDEIEPGIESWLLRVHPKDKERVGTRVHSVIDGTGQIWWDEYRFRRKDGTYAQIFDRGYVLRDAEGRALRIVGTMQDISERKEAEQRLSRLNRTHAVLSAINQLIVREREPRAILEGACRIAVDTGGFLLAWMGLADGPEEPVKLTAHAGPSNDSREVLEQLFGGAPHGCGLTAQPFAHGGHALCNDIASDSRAASWRDAALARGYRAMVSLPLMMGGRRGGIFNLYAEQKDFFDPEELRLLDDLAMDLAYALEGCERERDRQRAIEQFRASEERLRELAQTVQEVFWITDSTKTEILFISAAYEKIWGRTCASLYAAPDSWFDAIHPQDRGRIRQAVETKQIRGDYDETYRIVHADGSERWIHDRAFPVRGPDGNVLRVVGTAEDITNRRRLEEQLRQSQKMEAVGQLAGGVAHDFNNILTAIFMQVEISDMTDDMTPEVRDGLKLIKGCAERAANLTRQLLLFSHKQVMQPSDLDLNELVASLAKMLERLIEENVQLELNLHPAPLLTNADASMIDQVLMNLAVNARDAMPNGGHLVISTNRAKVTRDAVRLHPDAVPGNYVCLSVSDTGGGIHPDVLPRIFEPFFTTKGQGKGTGLGLATVFGIVKQHHGWVTVASELNRGTTFQIFLPATKVVSTGVARTARPAFARGDETILLVEDEAAVRNLTRVVLERAGYRVLEAADGVEAQRLWEEHGSTIRLLFTDMVMPGGVSGRELATALQERDSTLQVVFTSGYSADMAGREFISKAGQNFIQKPSSPQHLLETIRRCLDA